MARTKLLVAQRSYNSRWLRNAMQSIGLAGADIISELAPNITEASKGIASTVTNTVRSISQSRREGSLIARAMEANPYIRMARKGISNAFEDIKSGNLYNNSRSGFSFGDDDTGEEESQESISAGDQQVVSSISNLSGAINNQATAQLKASKANMDAMIAVNTANMNFHSQLNSNILNKLDDINVNIANIVSYQNQNMTKFIEASLAYYEKTGLNVSTIASPIEQENAQKKLSLANVINGSKGGLNVENYKNLVKQNFADYLKESPLGVALENPEMIEHLLANPIGNIMTMVGKGLVDRIFGDTIEGVEKSFSNFVPIAMLRLGELGNDNSPGLSGMVKRAIGSIFGAKTEKVDLNLNDAKLNRGATPFDEETKFAITEIITKELRDQSSYLKVLTEHFVGQGASDLAKSKQEYWDYNSNSYIKNSDINRSIAQDLSSGLLGAFNSTDFGSGLRERALKLTDLSNVQDNPAIINEIDKALNEFYLGLSRISGKGIITQEDMMDVLNKMGGNVHQDARDLLIQAIPQLNSNQINSASIGAINAPKELNNLINSLRENYGTNHLLDSDFNKNFETVDDLIDLIQSNYNKDNESRFSGRINFDRTSPTPTDNAVEEILANGGNLEDVISNTGERVRETTSRFVSRGIDYLNNGVNRVTGERVTDSNGNTRYEGGIISNELNTILFGDRENKGIINTVRNTLTSGFQNIIHGFFGEDSENPEETSKRIQKNLNDALPAMGKGAFAGVLTGLSPIGMMTGGPMLHASIGASLGFLSKNEHFMNFLFGKEEEMEDGSIKRIGGLISSQFQEYVKDNKGALATGATIGTGLGLMGMVAGGPVAGALLGTASSIVAKSKVFQRFLYGDEETGQLGFWNSIKSAWSRQVKDATTSDDAKKIGGIAATGALTGALLSKLGLLGFSALPFGPIGGAIAGLGVAIASQKDNIKKYLFGEEKVGSQGEKYKSAGLFGRIAGNIRAQILNPIKTELSYHINNLFINIEHAVLDPLRNIATFAAKNVAKLFTGAFGFVGNLFKGTASRIGGFLDWGLNKIGLPTIGEMGTFATNMFGNIAERAINLNPLNLAQNFIGIFDKETRENIARDRIMRSEQRKANKNLRSQNRLHDKIAKEINRITGGKYSEDSDEARNFIKVNFSHQYYHLFGVEGLTEEEIVNFGEHGWIPKNVYKQYQEINGMEESEDKSARLATWTKKQQEKAKYGTVASRTQEAKALATKTEAQWESDAKDNLTPENAAAHFLAKQLRVITGIGNDLKILRTKRDIEEEEQKKEERRREKEGDATNPAIEELKGLAQRIQESNETFDKQRAQLDEDYRERTEGKGFFGKIAPWLSRRIRLHNLNRQQDIANEGFRVEAGENKAEQLNTEGTIGTRLRSLRWNLLHGRRRRREGGEGGFGDEFDAEAFLDSQSDLDSISPSIAKSSGANEALPVYIIGSRENAIKIDDPFSQAREALENQKASAQQNNERAEEAAEEERQESEESWRAKILTILEGTGGGSSKEDQDAKKGGLLGWLASLGSGFASIFGGNGILTVALLAAAPFLLNAGKWVIENLPGLVDIIKGIAGSIASFFTSGIKDLFGTQGTYREDGRSMGEEAQEMIDTVTNKPLDIVNPLNEQGQADRFTKTKMNALAHVGAAVVDPVGMYKSTHAITKITGNIPGLKTASRFANAATDTLTIAPNVFRKGGAKAIGEIAEKSGNAKLAKLAADAQEAGTSVIGQTKVGKFVGGAVTNVKNAVTNTKAWNAVSSVGGTLGQAAGNLKNAVKFKVENNPLFKTVTDAIKSFFGMIKDKLKALPGKIGSFIDEIAGAITKHLPSCFEKIAPRVGLEAGTKGAAGAASLGLSELGFAVLGGIDGAMGTAKLFHVNSEDVDPLMMTISSVLGAAAGTTVGTIIDIVLQVVGALMGKDLLRAIATGLYTMINGGEQSEAAKKLTEAQKKFEQEYLNDRDAKIVEQYKTQLELGLIPADMTLEQFNQALNDGTVSVHYESEADYNVKKNASLYDHVGNFFGGAFNLGKNLLVGEDTLKDKNGNTYVRNEEGTYTVKDSTGKEIGKIDEATAKEKIGAEGKMGGLIGGIGDFFGGIGDFFGGMFGLKKEETEATDAAIVNRSSATAQAVAERGVSGSLENGQLTTEDTKRIWRPIDAIYTFYKKDGKYYSYYDFSGNLIKKNKCSAEDLEYLISQGYMIADTVDSIGDKTKINSALTRANGGYGDVVANVINNTDVNFRTSFGGRGDLSQANGGYGNKKIDTSGLGIKSWFTSLFGGSGESNLSEVRDRYFGKYNDERNHIDIKNQEENFFNEFFGGFGKKDKKRGGFGKKKDRLNGHTYYSQKDSRWAMKKYGSDAKMSDAGCGPSAVAMALSDETGGHISPMDMANLSQATGNRDQTGTNWNFVSKAANSFGVQSSQTINPTAKDISKALDKGHPVILSGKRGGYGNLLGGYGGSGVKTSSAYTGAGHYVVAVGKDKNGNVIINDPRGEQYSGSYDINKLAKETGSSWMFDGVGRPSRHRRRKGGFGKKRGGFGPSKPYQINIDGNYYMVENDVLYDKDGYAVEDNDIINIWERVLGGLPVDANVTIIPKEKIPGLSYNRIPTISIKNGISYAGAMSDDSVSYLDTEEDREAIRNYLGFDPFTNAASPSTSPTIYNDYSSNIPDENSQEYADYVENSTAFNELIDQNSLSNFNVEKVDSEDNIKNEKGFVWIPVTNDNNKIDHYTRISEDVLKDHWNSIRPSSEAVIGYKNIPEEDRPWRSNNYSSMMEEDLITLQKLFEREGGLRGNIPETSYYYKQLNSLRRTGGTSNVDLPPDGKKKDISYEGFVNEKTGNLMAENNATGLTENSDATLVNGEEPEEKEMGFFDKLARIGSGILSFLGDFINDIFGGRTDVTYDFDKYFKDNYAAPDDSLMDGDGSGNGEIDNDYGEFPSSGQGESGSIEDWMTVVADIKKIVGEITQNMGDGDKYDPGSAYSWKGSSTFEYRGKKITFRRDCSGYVCACLVAYGAIPDNLANQSTASMTESSSLGKQLTSTGWTYLPFEGIDKCVMGDIMLTPGKHTQIFFKAGNGNSYRCFNNGSNSCAKQPGDTASTFKPKFIIRPPESSKATISKEGAEERESVGTGSSVQLTGDTDREKYYNFLRESGLSPYAAAGILGNFSAESSINPKRVEGDYLNKPFPYDKFASSQEFRNEWTQRLFNAYRGKKINKGAYLANDSDYYPGVGLAQWTGPRGKALFDFAREKNADPFDTATQLDFIMNGPSEYPTRTKLNQAMSSAQSVDEATTYFYRGYEAGTNPYSSADNGTLSKRIEHANAIYREMGGKGEGTGVVEASNGYGGYGPSSKITRAIDSFYSDEDLGYYDDLDNQSKIASALNDFNSYDDSNQSKVAYALNDFNSYDDDEQSKIASALDNYYDDQDYYESDNVSKVSAYIDDFNNRNENEDLMLASYTPGGYGESGTDMGMIVRSHLGGFGENDSVNEKMKQAFSRIKDARINRVVSEPKLNPKLSTSNNEKSIIDEETKQQIILMVEYLSAIAGSTASTDRKMDNLNTGGNNIIVNGNGGSTSPSAMANNNPINTRNSRNREKSIMIARGGYS